MPATAIRPGRWLAWGIGALVALLAVLVALLGAVMAVVGGDLGCLGGASSGGGAQPAPSRSAQSDIPPERLRLYQQAGRRFRIDWTFLASVGAQECDHGACRGDNGYGCAGPMQIAVRRGSPCSPSAGPTLWEGYGVDADGDGRKDPNDPADAIFTAARILRRAKGAPPTGGSYAAYRQAACNYYGACGDAAVPYADEVMSRAVQYGFRGDGAPPATDPAQAQPVLASTGGCSATSAPGSLGSAHRAFTPRRLEPLPRGVTAGSSETCDARLVPDVVFLARRFGVLVTDCYSPSGHEATGEHPLGAAVDLVPRDGDWSRTTRLARAVGWERSCALSGTRPTCADPPFRFVGYNGFPNHGDPLNCVPCAGGPHLHISWQTSASPGQPDNQPRYGYEPAAWIEVLSGGTTEAADA
jgi:hypothetical protein